MAAWGFAMVGMPDQVGHDGRAGDDGDGGDCLRWARAIGFLILLGKDLRFIFNALYLYIIMYINLRALWLLSVLRNYATI